MQLSFILGSHPHDVLKQSVEEVAQCLQRGETCFLVVPDRLTFGYEKEMLDHIGGSFLFEVLTLNTLAHKILSTGRQPLSSFGAVLAIKSFLNQHAGKLSCFNKAAQSAAFAEELYKNIVQLKASGITYNEIKNNLSALPYGLRLKMQDIALIYEEYENFLKDNYSDGLSKFEALAKEIEKNELIKNAHLFFLGFEDYTHQIENIVRAAAKTAKKVYISDVVPFKTQSNAGIYPCSVFYKAKRICQSLNIVPQIIFAKVQPKSLDLRFLENHLLGFAQKRTNAQKVSLYKAATMQEEFAFAVQQILNLVQKGSRLHDIAIGLCNAENAEILVQFLNKANIPHYVDQKYSLLHHSLAKLLLCALDVFNNNLEQASVLALAKNDFFCFTPHQTGIFENFSVQFAITNGGFFSGFTKQEAEDVRVKLMSVLQEPYNLFKSCYTAEGYVFALEVLLKNLNAEEHLQVQAAAFTKAGDLPMARVCGQAYAKVCEVLAELKTICGTKTLTYLEFKNLLKTGLSSIEISLVPLHLDTVYIFDAQNIFLGKAKHLFILGASQKNFPLQSADSGLILDSEIARLPYSNKLSPSIKELNAKQLFRAFSLCLSGENLYMSYCVNMQGTENQPSLLLQEAQNLFACKIQSCAGFLKYQTIPFRMPKPLSLTRGDILFYPEKTAAITSLETYFTCPLKHFADKGLKLKPQELPQASALDVGLIYHDFACQFMQEPKLSRVNMILKSILQNEKYKKLSEIPANQAVIALIKKEVQQFARDLIRHDEASQFKPIRFESSFSQSPGDLKTITLKEVALRGKIDRIDAHGGMARIIDYKTGKADFHYKDVYFGQNLQLVSYLNVMRENGYSPAGAFYFPVHNAFDAKESKLNGFMLRDTDVLRALDVNLQNGGKSKVLAAAGFKQDGDMLASDKMLLPKEMADILSYSKKVAECAVSEIMAGSIAPSVIKTGQEENAICKNCILRHAFCCRYKYERNLSGYKINPEAFDG